MQLIKNPCNKNLLVAITLLSADFKDEHLNLHLDAYHYNDASFKTEQWTIKNY